MTQACKRECCPDLGDVLAPEFFKALCDPSRISILVRLAECCGELSVSQVAECCPINISVVSRHLAILRDAGILKSFKKGKEVFYSVRAESLVKSLRTIADAIESCCPTEKEAGDE
ncbi:MAG: ArsR family transcriptional regulator [Anaerolineales bacterium]|nr:MAG: ArsR family transcriptional regulator [Anaerolineales bacterium]